MLPDIIRRILDLVGEFAIAESRRGLRDDLCTRARALLDALQDDDAKRTLSRACSDVAGARNEAILAKCPADAALLDAALRVGSAVELLSEGNEGEARGYAGAALMPLAEARAFAGIDASVEEALVIVKAELKKRVDGSAS
jgi:hypothetical protein